MSRYIDVENFSQMIYENFGRDGEFDYRDLIRILREQPTTDVKKVVYGEWDVSSEYSDILICSKCGQGYEVWVVDNGANFCPNCGANMREGK